MIAITNAKIVLETGILWNGVLLIENDRIAAVGRSGEVTVPPDAERIDAQGAYVGPGFVDIHCHGIDGTRYDSDPVHTAAYVLRHGTTTALATLYHDLKKDQAPQVIEMVRQVIEHGQAPNLAGFYMEFPYMNPKYGASPEKNSWRGPIRREDYLPLLEAAGSWVKVWAVAPEREGLEPFMDDARKANPQVVFAVAHSEASTDQIQQLKGYGLQLMTHCTDATGRPPVEWDTRSCGPDEACFLDDDMYAEIICDKQGVHVRPDMLRMILKIKGVDKVILITDADRQQYPTPPEYEKYSDLTFDANGILSGSKMTMDGACRNIMAHTNCGIAQAFLMAARNPARAVSLDNEVGTIESGKKANLVFVDDMFHLKKVILNGKEVNRC